jgi:hypothetical protein
MQKVRSLVVGAAALIATPLMGLPAWGDACPAFTPVIANDGFVQFAAGGGGFNTFCNVDGVTFSNVRVFTIGSVVVGGLSPFMQGNEFGLTLNVASNAVGNGVSADVLWTYSVTGNLLGDAFASFTGTISGTGTATLAEQLKDPITLNTIASLQLLQPNTSKTITFDPIAALFVSKDQQSFSGTAGSAMISEITNAFSLVPGPIMGAGLPGLVVAAFGLVGLGRRRRQQA